MKILKNLTSRYPREVAVLSIKLSILKKAVLRADTDHQKTLMLSWLLQICRFKQTEVIAHLIFEVRVLEEVIELIEKRKRTQGFDRVSILAMTLITEMITKDDKVVKAVYETSLDYSLMYIESSVDNFRHEALIALLHFYKVCSPAYVLKITKRDGIKVMCRFMESAQGQDLKLILMCWTALFQNIQDFRDKEAIL